MELQRTLRVATIDHITPEPNEIDIAVHSSRHLMRDKFKSYLLSNLKTVCEKKNWPFYEICCLLYTSPSPRDRQKSRMPSSA